MVFKRICKHKREIIENYIIIMIYLKIINRLQLQNLFCIDFVNSVSRYICLNNLKEKGIQ